ncbi:hypothetical protein ANANG_G00131910 [Anguilla anguilla]|uniref:Uncharacterized protein n=1 Tax=Anguilla anguilla TaxID=7936 RepID=A0A9D3MFD0_ANGAN|nr:hypothetical protein ANANG_G00131910 [Anguilla anguilla]
MNLESFLGFFFLVWKKMTCMFGPVVFFLPIYKIQKNRKMTQEQHENSQTKTQKLYNLKMTHSRLQPRTSHFYPAWSSLCWTLSTLAAATRFELQACEEKGTMLKLNWSKTTTTLRWESNPGFFFFFLPVVPNCLMFLSFFQINLKGEIRPTRFL